MRGQRSLCGDGGVTTEASRAGASDRLDPFGGAPWRAALTREGLESLSDGGSEIDFDGGSVHHFRPHVPTVGSVYPSDRCRSTTTRLPSAFMAEGSYFLPSTTVRTQGIGNLNRTDPRPHLKRALDRRQRSRSSHGVGSARCEYSSDRRAILGTTTGLESMHRPDDTPSCRSGQRSRGPQRRSSCLRHRAFAICHFQSTYTYRDRPNPLADALERSIGEQQPLLPSVLEHHRSLGVRARARNGQHHALAPFVVNHGVAS
jgi:hypothetical protein